MPEIRHLAYRHEFEATDLKADQAVSTATVAEEAAGNAVGIAQDAENKAAEAALLAGIAQDDAAAARAGVGAGVVGYATLAELELDLNHAENTIAYVTNDSTPENNGTYRKVGGTGTGSWEQSSFDRVAQVETDLRNRAEYNSGTAALVAQTDTEGRVLYYVDADGHLRVPMEHGYSSVQNALGSIDAVTGSGALLALADADDRVIAHWDTAAGMHLVGATETVQETQRQVRESGLVEIPAKIDLVRSSLARGYLETQRAVGLLGDPVFVDEILSPHGADDQTTQRTPGIYRLSDTQFLIGFCQRAPDMTGDAEGQRLVVLTATYDPELGTLTGSARRVIQEPEVETDFVAHPHFLGLSNGKIAVLYNSNESTHVIGRYDVYMRISDDDGQTWGEPELVAEPLPGPDIGRTMALGSNGSTVTIPDGYPNAGRMLVPVYGRTDTGWFIGVLYSDDDAETWEVSVHYPPARVTETAIAWTHEGDILMIGRRGDSPDNNPIPGLNHMARSHDGGITWIDEGLNLNLPQPRSNACIVQAAVYPGDGIPAILHTGNLVHSGGPTVRRHHRLRVSFDAGRSWPWQYRPAPMDDNDDVGYTSICRLSDGVYAVAYERGPVNVEQSIGAYIVNNAEIYSNGSRTEIE